MQTKTKNATIYVVHPNVGLRPPSAGIDYLIIQLMEITVKSHSSQTLSQPLRAYKFIAIYKKLINKCNLIHSLT